MSNPKRQLNSPESVEIPETKASKLSSTAGSDSLYSLTSTLLNSTTIEGAITAIEEIDISNIEIGVEAMADGDSDQNMGENLVQRISIEVIKTL